MWPAVSFTFPSSSGCYNDISHQCTSAPAVDIRRSPSTPAKDSITHRRSLNLPPLSLQPSRSRDHPFLLKPFRLNNYDDEGTRRPVSRELPDAYFDNLCKLWTNCNGFNIRDVDCATSHIIDAVTTSIEAVATTKDSAKSPKQKLGKEWREYQGSNNWEGLLDPLDENLRREIVKYGEFVQATYNAFQFDPHSKDYGCCKYPKHSLLDKSGLIKSGYKVTRNIHATSAIQVPQWLTTPFSNSNSDGDQSKWMTRRTSWVGFVAVTHDKREIARLGRRDIVVAFRGTATPLEWAENLKAVLTPLNIPEDDHMTRRCSPCGCCLQPKVESGFWSLFTSKGPRGQSASNQVMEEVRRLVNLYKHEEISVTVTGHSLGAALALLTAYQIGAAFNSKESSIPVTVFSFGGPRVGNRAFGRRMEALGCRVLRIVNTHDVITKVPGVVLNEWMHIMKRRSDNLKKVIRLLEKMPWAYCHVGTELRVNNKHSPYLKPIADVSCCHDLEAYLHLVDGFFSSTTPFRSTAKRDFRRPDHHHENRLRESPGIQKETNNSNFAWTSSLQNVIMNLHHPEQLRLFDFSRLPSAASDASK